MSKKIILSIIIGVIIVLSGILIWRQHSSTTLPTSTSISNLPIPTPTQYISTIKAVKLAKIPEGAEILFHQSATGTGASPEGTSQFYVMDGNGGAIFQITFENPRKYERMFASYDRRYLAATETLAPAPEPRSALWVFDLRDGTEARIAPDFYSAGGGAFDFGLDGFLYFSCQEKPYTSHQLSFEEIGRLTAICRIKPDGSNLEKVVTGGDAAKGDIALSKDGTLMVYIRVVKNEGPIAPGEAPARAELWAAHPDGTDGRFLARLKGMDVDPEFSPDGKKIIMEQGSNHMFSIYEINVDGTGYKPLIADNRSLVLPDWVDNRILYSEFTSQGMVNYIYDVTTGVSKKIATGPQYSKWLPPMRKR